MAPTDPGAEASSDREPKGPKRAKRIDLRVVIRAAGKELGRVRVRPTSKLSVVRKIVSKRVSLLPQRFGFVREDSYVPSAKEDTVTAAEVVAAAEDGAGDCLFIYDVFQG